jgi:hypothetical protein
MLSESEGAQRTEGESKHPDIASPAMLRQGILFEASSFSLATHAVRDEHSKKRKDPVPRQRDAW